ncbi:MAG: L-threonylcarbamoyladenylate synthase [Polaromonas sp.]|uniref:L-threonylcarbamoyladenylate synthase n=1 Tax=Polaromonas sp. TaxID=1869339 RepID=UPI002731365D|nr:L-threonylcarbamoyladenylate synthase [Polaromonas sp.]MDP2448287.1 L-threonylcarbamoyladenylate synthase [Polaromonas sp.]MDP3246913.1 L-threonylcarbamoyladenylate synthase [Polaromonas sp.]MDP3754299.1 L-threonylcarbamoyladenylate synthase [Polaromonas sp.]
MIRGGTDPAVILEAARVIRAGGLVGFPTETVYGLGADASSDSAVAGIFAAKGRPSDHPLIVHVADAAQVLEYASSVPPFAARLMQAFWPGPLTVILPRKPGVAAAAAGGQDSIGLRCPSHPVALAFLKACATGVAGPSANRFGRVSPTTARHVVEEFGDTLLVLDGGPCAVGIESSIVDCTRGRPVLLRPGLLTRAQLEAACGEPVLDKDEGQQEDATLGEAPRASGTLASHYAPNARVRLMDAGAIQTALDVLGAQAAHIAVYARSIVRIPSAQVLYRRMPDDAAATAQQLFAVLRDFDAQGVKLIWIENLPADPAWEGVRDRLQRAAAS